jgi:hypothetical protein
MKRDASPVRSKPKCAACGTRDKVSTNIACSEYQCTIECKRPDNYGCGQTRQAEPFQVVEKPRRGFTCQTKGLLDTLPRQLSTHAFKERGASAYAWRGIYLVELKSNQMMDMWIDWLGRSYFQILEQKRESFLLKSTLRDKPWEVFFGALPCTKSVALGNDTKIWHHFRTPELQEMFENSVRNLERFCGFVSVVVGLQPLLCLSVPRLLQEPECREKFIDESYK